MRNEMGVMDQLIYSVRSTLSHMLDPNKPKGSKPITSKQTAQIYDKHNISIGSYMPYLGYKNNVFYFDDTLSCAMVFDLKPIATEGRSSEFKSSIADKIEQALAGQFNEQDIDEGEWVVQQFRWKDNDLGALADEAYLYATDFAREAKASEVILKQIMRKHYDGMAQEGGLFEDSAVTKQNFQGGIERTKIVIYRKYPKAPKNQRRFKPELEITRKTDALAAEFKRVGLDLVVNDEFDFFHWLVKFFNEKPKGMPSEEFYHSITPRCDESGELPDDIPAHLFVDRPAYIDGENAYKIGNTYHKTVRVQQLSGNLHVGQLTGEVNENESVTCATDSMPDGTMMAITSVFCSKRDINAQINSLKNLSKSNIDPSNEQKRIDLKKHETILANNKFKATLTSICCYVRSTDLDELEEKVNSVCTALISAKMVPIKELNGISDPLAGNAFLYHLPMCFDPTVEKARACLMPMYLHHMVSSSFFYGREIGTGNPLLLLFNRSGGLLTTDILKKSDRESNAHMLIVGSTGSGKSATMVYLTCLLVAIKRPRLYIVEAGGSFNHVAEFLKYHGLSVNKLTLSPSNPEKNHTCPSMAPFATLDKLVPEGAIELTEEEQQIAERNRKGSDFVKYDVSSASSIQLKEKDVPDYEFKNLSEEIKEELAKAKLVDKLEAKGKVISDNQEASDQKDRLGEIELIAFTMITSGEQKEIDLYKLADRRLLRMALLNAAKSSYINNQPANVQTVANELHKLSEDVSNTRITNRSRENLSNMAYALEYYTEGFQGELLNAESHEEVFPDVDVTIIDLATLAKPGNEVLLSIVYISLLQQLNGLAEKHQHSGRLMIKMTDECHLITKNDLTALYIVKVVKLWRKLNAFAWFATQNMTDFPKESNKLLSMIEWIMMLTPKPSEIKDLQKYKTISDEKVSMANNTCKLDKCYTEGVLFGEIFDALFRLVQPSEMLAMAGTDGEEKEKLAELSSEIGNLPLWKTAIYHAVKLDIARKITPIRYPFLEEHGLYDERLLDVA